MESPFENIRQTTTIMYVEPILNTYYKTYHNVITLSGVPAGPLADMVKAINPPKLSAFQSFSPFAAPFHGAGSGCVHALMRYPVRNIYNSAKYSTAHMSEEDIPSIFAYLRSHGYVIETEMAKMLFMSNVDMGGVAQSRLSGNRKMVCVFSFSSGT